MQINTRKSNSLAAAFLIGTMLACTGIAVAKLSDYETNSVEPSKAINTMDSTYRIQSLKLNNETSGRANILLDDFNVVVHFDFEKFPNFEHPSIPFTDIDIVNLYDISITDDKNRPYNDFTDHIDHQNIIKAVHDHIIKNQLLDDSNV